MKIRPLHDRILLKRKTEEERTAGGLYIPDSAKERATQATVVAVGKGRILQDGTVVSLKVKPGDTVLFGKYAGNEIKLDGEELMLMREDEILAVIES
ncbi:MAG TPA: co-chaperone GroES [Pseudomonadota bacterium]|nr:co-chaperone GroES [Pseudomonadota bacterium]